VCAAGHVHMSPGCLPQPPAAPVCPILLDNLDSCPAPPACCLHTPGYLLPIPHRPISAGEVRGQLSFCGILLLAPGPLQDPHARDFPLSYQLLSPMLSGVGTTCTLQGCSVAESSHQYQAGALYLTLTSFPIPAQAGSWRSRNGGGARN
jgi:hypothetical protein